MQGGKLTAQTHTGWPPSAATRGEGGRLHSPSLVHSADRDEIEGGNLGQRTLILRIRAGGVTGMGKLTKAGWPRVLYVRPIKPQSAWESICVSKQKHVLRYQQRKRNDEAKGRKRKSRTFWLCQAYQSVPFSASQGRWTGQEAMSVRSHAPDGREGLWMQTAAAKHVPTSWCMQRGGLL